MTAMQQQGAAAKAATYALAAAGTAEKNAALEAIANILTKRQAEWLAANAQDVAAAKEAGMRTAMLDWAGSDVTDRMKTFYAAHNEYLEQLLTTGLLGLAAWVWFIVAHLRRSVKNWLRPGVAPVTLALVSYLAHAVVSIRVSMIFPEIMLLFGLLQVFCLPPEEEAHPAEKPRHGKVKKTREVPAEKSGLVRLWAPPALAAILMMAVCGAASHLFFGFLF